MIRTSQAEELCQLSAENPHNMSPPALLVVLSEPGNGVPEELFHDWYDNEHIPLRVATETFSSWVRLEGIDGQKPRFGAIYDLSSFDDTRIPPYTTLAETRSEREIGIFMKSELFDRRIYDLYDKQPHPPPSDLFNEKQAAPLVVLRGLEAKEGTEEELSKWYIEEHIPMLSKVPGWVRSRWFVLRESQYVGTEAGKQTKAPTKYLAVHEWADSAFEVYPEYRAALGTPWRAKVMENVVGTERRVFRFMKQWQRE